VPLRTGDSRGFAFVRYKYADEAQKAIDRLDGGLRYRGFSEFRDFWHSTSDLYCPQDEMSMGGTSWCSLPSMVPMRSQCE
jgi:RNA recognition motif-containing protein